MKNPKERIIIALFLLLALICIYGMAVFSSNEISISAKSAALYEPCGKQFLYEKNADARLPMASTTKIMTALIAVESNMLDEVITIDDEAIGIEGSSMYLAKGEKILLRDLLYGVMLRSANDAAAAVAFAVAGGIEEFAELMNAKARELGCANTNFTNPHGLDEREHYTTARDLAVIAARALENPVFKEIVSTKKCVVKNTDGLARLLVNHNKLLSLYDGAIGVKTGYTKRSGRCLVGATEKNGMMLISVTIDAPDDWNDHSMMLNYGYNNYEAYTLATPESYNYRIPVLDSKLSYVEIKNVDSLTVIRRRGATVSSSVDLPRALIPPFNEGECVGTVSFTINGEYVGCVDLVTTSTKAQAKRGIFSIF